MAVNEQVLSEVIDELLDEPDRNSEEKPDKGFFWRVIFLYKEKLGIKPEPAGAAAFYNALHEAIAEILNQRRRPAKRTVRYSPMKPKKEFTPAWQKEEIDREDRNEQPPRFTI